MAMVKQVGASSQNSLGNGSLDAPCLWNRPWLVLVIKGDTTLPDVEF